MVIPAEAGIQVAQPKMEPGLRGDDGITGGSLLSAFRSLLSPGSGFYERSVK
jgi:hypothetical protein